MEKQFEIIRQTRKFLLTTIEELTTEQLNEIPEGFNNNIIWNLAHIVAAQQGVCYVRGGLKPVIDDQFFNAYKPDTKPTTYVDEAEIAKIKEWVVSTIDRLEQDYNSKIFEGYQSWTNRYGVEHRSIDDTLYFLPFHDGFHIGYITALKRVVKNKR